METWDNKNLPENHQLFEKVTFVAVVEGTWNRKKQDGTNEVAPKWDYITQETEQAPAMQVGVYSSTDHEAIELNKSYDIIVKRAVGKDGTFYGYSMKGYGVAGQPIPKKEPQSRFQKGLKMSNKAIALQASSTIFSGVGIEIDSALVIDLAEIFVAWLDGDTKPDSDKKIVDSLPK